MFFKLPLRGMYRPPRTSQGAEVGKRKDSLVVVQQAAQEMLEDPEVLALWTRKDEKGILTLCKNKEWEVGEPSYVSAGMIFKALKGLLRSANG